MSSATSAMSAAVDWGLFFAGMTLDEEEVEKASDERDENAIADATSAQTNILLVALSTPRPSEERFNSSDTVTRGANAGVELYVPIWRNSQDVLGHGPFLRFFYSTLSDQQNRHKPGCLLCCSGVQSTENFFLVFFFAATVLNAASTTSSNCLLKVSET